MKQINHFAIVAICISISGCNTTKGIGHLNPEFNGHQLNNIAVYVDNQGEMAETLESGIVNELTNRGVKAVSVGNLSRFAKSNDDFVSRVWGLGVKEILVVVYSDSEGSATAGYQTFGTANTYGNTTNFNMTSTPMVGFYRTMMAKASIYNAKGDKIWEADTERSAQGLAFIGDNLTISETESAIIQSLHKDHLIP